MLRALSKGTESSASFADARFIAAVDELEEHGLVHGLWLAGHTLEGVRLTNKGRTYLRRYPDLRGPVDWRSWLALVLSAVSVIASIIGLFVACKIYRIVSE